MKLYYKTSFDLMVITGIRLRIKKAPREFKVKKLSYVGLVVKELSCSGLIVKDSCLELIVM